MSTTLDTSGLDRLADGLARIANPDATDLMMKWQSIIDEDNRKGILAGLDKDGMPLIPVTYRPKPPGPVKPTRAQRGGARAGAKKGAFQGLVAAGLGNLTSGQYRLLGGPPLAPRDQFSRVITNLHTGYGREGNGNWYAEGHWEEVVSTRGVPFLIFHFTGRGRLPRRDLRGVRPAGVAKAAEALRNWARLLVRQAFGR